MEARLSKSWFSYREVRVGQVSEEARWFVLKGLLVIDRQAGRQAGRQQQSVSWGSICLGGRRTKVGTL
jgi:hypothetical protein